MSELIFIFILLIISGIMITTYHLYEKFGLKVLLIIMTILYLIMSFKTTSFLGININLNLLPIISIYTIFILLIEKHSKKELYDDLKLVIKTISITIPIFILFILYPQSINDKIILNPNHLLDYIPSIISLLIMPLFIILIIYLYKFLKDNTKNFYINTIIATILTLIIETTISTIIIYIKQLDIKLTIQILLANFLIKTIIILINLGIIKLLSNQRKWLS